MSVSYEYYDPKRPAGYSSAAKLVKACKNKKGEWKSGCEVRTRKLYTNL